MKENKEPKTNVQPTGVKVYQPKKSLGYTNRQSSISDVAPIVSKPLENPVTKTRKSYQNVETKTRPKSTINCVKIGLDNKKN